ncbi:enoyl-CoA hydratase [Thioflexithrix psekupsensis]|uniref:Enoyl-CoA hydratase domain-containing protein 3, mitochondrial n=1 Tax=Thioflexithrix psekupsensis TaxID=1570016 RepID=A0A251X4Q7_9GAMM|nr:enoyl-CoA hydratase [Thioflexithrix psekupsensis]OUD12376.1 enoyl-CoA hydratase [Thioflexithrix psekupsensis]
MTEISDNNTPYVLCEQSEGVALLTLNRPQQYNALSDAMLSALETELARIATDESIRVVVLAAKGKAFCAGHDLKEMRQNATLDFCQNLFNHCSQVMLMINQLPQPVIAKVQGLATAAGCQLVAACDLAVAVDTAKFATSGINVGLFCATPAVPISRNLGRKQAMELLLTGDFIDAQTALDYGLLNRVVSAEQLDEATQYFVQSILVKSAIAIKMGKQLFYQQLEMPLTAAYQQASTVMANNMLTADAKEGLTAFAEKRAPVWCGH